MQAARHISLYSHHLAACAGGNCPQLMDAYPHHYVEHNTPLLVLSGLRNPTLDFFQATGPSSTRISCPVPPVDTPLANTLLRCFLATNASGVWSGKSGRNLASSRGPNPVFRVKTVGRVSFSSFFKRGFNAYRLLLGPRSATTQSKSTRASTSNIPDVRRPSSPHASLSTLASVTAITHLS